MTKLLQCVGFPLRRALLSGGISLALLAGPAFARDEVRFNLGWTDLGYFAPLFVAKEKGYFQEENIDVSFRYGSGATQALQQTGTGMFDLALADVTVGMQAYSQGVPVRLVATYGAKSVITYVALKESGIASAKDLEGKRLGGPPSDTGIALLPAFGKVAGFDATKVKVMNLDAGVRVPSLFQKSIDLIVSFDGGSLPILELEAKKQGRDLTIIRWRDYGFNALGLGLWANAGFAANKPDVLRRFLHAAARGSKFTIESPDQAAQIYGAVAGTLNPEATKLAVRAFAQTYNHASQTRGLGFIDPADLQTTYNLGIQFLGLKDFNVNEAYTNSFIEASPVKPPQ